MREWRFEKERPRMHQWVHVLKILYIDAFLCSANVLKLHCCVDLSAEGVKDVVAILLLKWQLNTIQKYKNKKTKKLQKTPTESSVWLALSELLYKHANTI